MPAKQEPNIGINYGWDQGESGIHLQLDENWRAIGALMQLSALSASTDTPASPAPGDRYIIPAGATGDWSGHDGKVARFIEGAWELYTPTEGWQAYVIDTAALMVYQAGQWDAIDIASAVQVSYSPAAGMTATNVQGAIDELKTSVDQAGSGLEPTVVLSADDNRVLIAGAIDNGADALQVEGSANFTGALNVDGALTVGTLLQFAPPLGEYSVIQGNNSDRGLAISANTNSTDGAQILVMGDVGHGGIYGHAVRIFAGAAGSQRLNLFRTGNLVLGSDTEISSHKLQVNGSGYFASDFEAVGTGRFTGHLALNTTPDADAQFMVLQTAALQGTRISVRNTAPNNAIGVQSDVQYNHPSPETVDLFRGQNGTEVVFSVKGTGETAVDGPLTASNLIAESTEQNAVAVTVKNENLDLSSGESRVRLSIEGVVSDFNAYADSHTNPEIAGKTFVTSRSSKGLGFRVFYDSVRWYMGSTLGTPAMELGADKRLTVDGPITVNGNATIGTILDHSPVPGSYARVRGNSDGRGLIMSATTDASNGGQILLQGSGTNNGVWASSIRCYAGGSERMTLFPTGNLVIGNTTELTSDKLQISGNAYATGTFIEASDEAIKTGIQDLNPDKKARLRGRRFRKKMRVERRNPDTDETQIEETETEEMAGLVAQDVEQVAPLAVTTTETGEKAIRLSSVIAYLASQIADLQDEVERLQARPGRGRS